MPECNKATREQIQDACQGIASSGSLADMYIGLAMSHLNGALEKTELISQLLNQRRREFSIIEKRVQRGDDKLTQEDLTASLEAATDLKQKFEKASTTANQVGKDLESVLQSFHKELEELLPIGTVDESEKNEDSESDLQESLTESDEQKCSAPTVDNSTSTGFVPMSISSIVAPQIESRRSEIPPPPEGSANGITSNAPQLANHAQSNNAWLMAPYTGYGTQQANNNFNRPPPGLFGLHSAYNNSFATPRLGSMPHQQSQPLYNANGAALNLPTSGHHAAGWYTN